MVTKHALELPAACLVAYCTVGAAALHVLFSIFPHFLSLSPWSLPPWACTSQIKPRHCQSCLGSILTASHQGLSMLYCGTAEALLTHLLLTFSWSIQWFSFLLSTILWMLVTSTLLAAVSWTLLHFHLSCVPYTSTWAVCFTFPPELGAFKSRITFSPILCTFSNCVSTLFTYNDYTMQWNVI